MKYYKIAIPEIKKTYTFFSESEINPGYFCSVKVRNRQYVGIVVEKDNSIDNSLKYNRISSIYRDFTPLSKNYIDFIKTISNYYFTDYGVFFSIAFPSKMFKGIEFEYSLNSEKVGLFLTDEELKIVTLLKEKPMKLKEIKKYTGEEDVVASLKNLEKLGLIKKEIANPFKRAETTKRKAVSLLKIPEEKEIEAIKRKSPAQFRVLDYLVKNKGVNFFLVSELSDRLKVSSSSFESLEKKGFVRLFYDYPSLIKEHPQLKEIITLNKYQEKFYRDFLNSKNGVYYLFGVTGSGKTEVYLRCAEAIISEGKTVLYLVPEIGLTPAAISRLKVRFGKDIAILHSGLSYGERISEWLRVLNEKVKIVVGTRSAIFAPLKNLGLIIVDEEHDHSYKQENFPKYNAVHCALFRGKIDNIPIILGSASPSVEIFYNAKKGKYKLYKLPERAGESGFPSVEIIDMMEEFKKAKGKKKIFAETTINEIKKVIDSGGQVLIFVNRRGYAPFLMCRKCGFIEMCPNCSVSLTVHSDSNSYPLQCHYCGYGKEIPDVCPSCGDNFIQMMGYGTQRIEKRLKSLFPKAKIERVDRDTVSTKNAFENFMTKMNRREIDIVVGTQMIAKGHHFPYLRLSVIVDADSLISFPDFRSAERAFSLFLQVGGRAGRELKGKVLIQTYKPEHYIFKYLKNHDYLSFFDKEIDFRKKALYPPFAKIIVVEIKGNDEEKVAEFSNLVGNRLKEKNVDGKVQILGPVKASIFKVHNKFRYHIILKSKDRRSLRSLFKKGVLPFLEKKLSGIVIIPDIDPYSIM
ncbi:replication restart helicase PriA [Thermotomaculum hydrothermale]|nr:primosomal protein N' [Thermotomaculum hydrothermale]